MGKDIFTLPFSNIDNLLGEPHYTYRVLKTLLTDNQCSICTLHRSVNIIAITSTKLSMLFFYNRIFSPHCVSTPTIVVGALCLGYGITFAFGTIFECSPIPFAWQNWDGEREGRCVNINAMVWANAAVNIVLDIVIISMPILQLLKLSMSRKRKMYILMMFSVGFLYVSFLEKGSMLTLFS